ncbi:hypothetical protein V6N13_015431 [Hibiscus sabdariffa]
MCLHDHGDGKAALWNPSTRKFKILPPSKARHPPFPGYSSFKCVGFKYDSKTDDYKVNQFITLVYLDNEFVYPPEFSSQVDLVGPEKSYELWVMNGAWTKQFSVESISGVQNLLGSRKNGELFFRGSSHELLLFEPSTRELKKLGINAYQDATCFVAYVESLVPINEDQSMMNI